MNAKERCGDRDILPRIKDEPEFTEKGPHSARW